MPTLIDVDIDIVTVNDSEPEQINYPRPFSFTSLSPFFIYSHVFGPACRVAPLEIPAP